MATLPHNPLLFPRNAQPHHTSPQLQPKIRTRPTQKAAGRPREARRGHLQRLISPHQEARRLRQRRVESTSFGVVDRAATQAYFQHVGQYTAAVQLFEVCL